MGVCFAAASWRDGDGGRGRGGCNNKKTFVCCTPGRQLQSCGDALCMVEQVCRGTSLSNGRRPGQARRPTHMLLQYIQCAGKTTYIFRRKMEKQVWSPEGVQQPHRGEPVRVTRGELAQSAAPPAGPQGPGCWHAPRSPPPAASAALNHRPCRPRRHLPRPTKRANRVAGRSAGAGGATPVSLARGKGGGHAQGLLVLHGSAPATETWPGNPAHLVARHPQRQSRACALSPLRKGGPAEQCPPPTLECVRAAAAAPPPPPPPPRHRHIAGVVDEAPIGRPEGTCTGRRPFAGPSAQPEALPLVDDTATRWRWSLVIG